MNLSKITAALQKFAPVIAAVATGIASIATKNYSEGISQILQALAVAFGGTAVVSLHREATNVPSGVISAVDAEVRRRD